MSITVQEKHLGTSGNTTGWKYDYVITDDDGLMTEFQAATALANAAPASISDGEGGFLVLADVQLSEFRTTSTKTIAIGSASYNLPEEGSGLSTTSHIAEASYEFSYQAPSAHVYLALATTPYGTNAPNFGNRINCRYDGPDVVCDGLDLPAGNTTNVWRLTVPRGFVTSTYEALVEGMVGSVNSAPFKGRPAHTMRFVQVQSNVTKGASMSIAWGFQYSPNVTGLSIDGIDSIAKGGHELISRLDEKKLDPINNKLILQARAIYVHQVFPLADFNQLGF